MPDGSLLTPLDDPSEVELRVSVVEMMVASIAAKLPPSALEEVVSLLVFVAKGADAAAGAGEAQPARAVATHATRMLERLATARRGLREPGTPQSPPNSTREGGA